MSSPQPKPLREAPARARADAPMRTSSRTDTLILGAVCIALAVQIVMFWLVARPQRDANSLDEMQRHILTQVRAIQGADGDTDLTKLRDTQQSATKEVAKKIEQKIDDGNHSIEIVLKEENAALQKEVASLSSLPKEVASLKKQNEDLREQLTRLDTNTKTALESTNSQTQKNFKELQEQINKLPDQIKQLLDKAKPGENSKPEEPLAPGKEVKKK